MLGNLDKWLETTKTSISENAKRDEKDLLSTMEKIHKETLSAIYWYSSIPKDLNAKLEKEVSYMVGSIRGAEYAHLVPEMEEEYYEAHREAYYALKKLAALADIAEDVTSISETGMYLLAKESFEGIKASISKYFEVSTNISLLGAEATHKKMSDELAKFDISTGDHHAMEILRTRELENAKKLREFINSCANPSSH